MTQPLSNPVPADDAGFAARKGMLRVAVRSVRGALQLRSSGQRPRLRARLDPAWRRLLWIHEGMPQIGDALMDLAPRSLLREHGLSVDLYAPPHIASLFEGDRWFEHSLSRPDDLAEQGYDAAIVLGNSRRALLTKRRHLRRLPWVSLHGDYNGPDFHRAQFATQRLADLLGIVLNAADFDRHSAQKLHWLADDAIEDAAPQVPEGSVALVLGGVRAQRIYPHWAQVLHGLQALGLRHVVLLGADNGRAQAAQLMATSTPPFGPLDLVGRTTLRQAHAVLGRCAVAACCDGGLMHLALTTDCPVVALFDSSIDPAWRLPRSARITALRSASDAVDGVPPESVVQAVMARWQAAGGRSPADRAQAGPAP